MSLRTLHISHKRAALILAALAVLALGASLALAKSGPAAPTIISAPPATSGSSTASFSFTDTTKSVSFLCQLDSGTAAACNAGAITYTGLANGSHTLAVQAEDSAGNLSSATTYTWSVYASPPPPPNLTTNPASLANQASASFSFTDTEVGVSFLCKLDSGTAVACTSPQTYSGLADGSHTFSVQARDPLGHLSTATPDGWTVDTTPPPAPSITSTPPAFSNQASASFGFKDSEVGVSFRCKLDSGGFAPCTSPQTYSGLANGPHTFSVEAQDAAGNVSAATKYSWTVNTNPPPPPTITSQPSSPTTDTNATLGFTDAQAGVSFQCQLDGGAFTACTSPQTYTGLSTTKHTFAIVAVDASGNSSSATSYSWTINSPHAFQITGDASPSTPLYPGGSTVVLPLTLTNPNNQSVAVTALTATVASTGAAGCPTTWFTTIPANIPAPGILIPANSSVTMPTQGATAPTVQMLDSGTNQDACERAHLTLTYSGSAHS